MRGTGPTRSATREHGEDLPFDRREPLIRLPASALVRAHPIQRVGQVSRGQERPLVVSMRDSLVQGLRGGTRPRSLPTAMKLVWVGSRGGAGTPFTERIETADVSLGWMRLDAEDAPWREGMQRGARSGSPCQDAGFYPAHLALTLSQTETQS